MNWARVKTVLIFIFISLNIFLLVNIISIKSEGSISKDVIDEAVKVIQNRGVKVKCRIPDYHVECAKLNYELVDFDKVKAARLLTGDNSISGEIADNAVDKNGKKVEFLSDGSIICEDTKTSGLMLSDDSSIKEYLSKLLKGLNIPVGNYVRDSFVKQKDGTDAIYVEEYRKFLVYDNYIEIGVRKDKTTVKFMYHRIIGLTNGQNGKIIPAYQVLLSNFPKDSDYNAIEKVDVGFKILDEEKGIRKGTKNPVWRVQTNGSNHYIYFNIYNGNKVYPVAK